LTLSAKLI